MPVTVVAELVVAGIHVTVVAELVVAGITETGCSWHRPDGPRTLPQQRIIQENSILYPILKGKRPSIGA